MSRRTFLAAFLALAIALPSQARQSTPSPPLLEYLTNGIDQEPMVQAAREQLRWFDNNRYGVAYGDELDVRFGQTTNERTEYGFRFRPTNPFYFLAGRQMGSVLEDKARLMFRVAMEEALYERALELLEIWESAAQLQQFDHALSWRSQWLGNMQTLVAAGDFDPEQFLDLEVEKLDLQVDRTITEDNLLSDLQKYGLRTNGIFETDQVITQLLMFRFDSLLVDRILGAVDAPATTEIVMPVEVEEKQVQFNESAARLKLEKSDWDIGFVQPEWDDQGGDNFGIRLGLGIPVFRANRMQRQNRQLDLINDKWEQAQALTKSQQAQANAKGKVVGLANRLASLRQLEIQLDAYQQKVRSLEGEKARETLLKWRKAEEKLDKRKIEVQFLLLQSYLDYLKLTGGLALSEQVVFFEDIW